MVTCRRPLLTELEGAGGASSGDAADAVWDELCGQNWRVRKLEQILSQSAAVALLTPVIRFIQPLASIHIRSTVY